MKRKFRHVAGIGVDKWHAMPYVGLAEAVDGDVAITFDGSEFYVYRLAPPSYGCRISYEWNHPYVKRARRLLRRQLNEGG